MRISVQNIGELNFAVTFSMRYGVFGYNYETWFTEPQKSHSYCWQLIDVPVHGRGFCRYPYNRLITAYINIPVAIMSV